jgi:phage terminase Nu1 subunit (DNA packaging protein)
LSRATVYRRLREAGLTGKEGGTYTTAQVAEALYSDYTSERTALVRSQREEQEMRVRQMKGELLDRAELTQALTHVFIAIQSVIANSSLPKSDQDDLLNELASIPIVVDEATKRSKQR